ncbi:MAG: gamma-glutamyl-gamma-aminobutyrate hydrolase family protein [Phycisphaerae bacterium]
MPPLPVIGITMDTRDGAEAYHLNFDYARAVERAGGLPLAIPYKTSPALIPQYVDLFDGLLFTGGNDLDPAAYGQTWHPKAEKVDPDRQSFEMALLAEVERRRSPMLAVCLGCQVLNVYRGGNLHQFLPDLAAKQEHRRVDGVARQHGVSIEPDSHLGRALAQTSVVANTFHKQAVDRVGQGLRVTALSDDGIVEAIEDPTLPLMLGVQWHPERMIDEDVHLAPFRLLVSKATEFRAARRGQG